MSGGKRARSELSPTLFPFLAVLLCTVGALVLMLVLVVGQSQASVQEAIEHRDHRADQWRAQVEVLREAFREDREKIQLEIEKKRKTLEALEQQTTQLTKELEQLDKTAQLADKKLNDSDDDQEIDRALSDLQKQLAEAAEKLKEKFAKPSGDKPVFAIIPYEGNHGTHRRPIYLECRADGILVQPEGVLIGLKDLKPPYGPGNPLDAALRAIRAHYAPDTALNTSAYPLLVVRASGIRTYALARMAMAGWDDQFGYELVGDEMELAFPEGDPSLVGQLERTLTTARSRQAALVMAMPGRYRQAMDELSEDKLNFDDGEGGWGNGTGTGTAFSGSEFDGSALAGFSAGQGGSTGQQPSAISGARGGFSYSPDGTPIGSAPSSLRDGSASGTGGSNGLQGFATGGTTMREPPKAGGNSLAPTADPRLATTSLSGQAMTFGQAAMVGNQYTSGAQSGGDSNSSRNSNPPGEGGGQMSQRADGSAGSQGTFRDALNAARSKQDGSANTQGELASNDVDQGTGGSQMASAYSEGFGSAGTNTSAMSTESASPMMEFGNKAKENSEAIAKRKGRNWAWTAGPPRQTAVVRNVRLVCYEDRWVVLPDAGSSDKPTTILLDVSLQSSAEQLAKVVADKMDRWGYALSGGYWKPVLQVEVAPRGEMRYQQLTRLLEASGLEIQLLKPNPPTGAPVYK